MGRVPGARFVAWTPPAENPRPGSLCLKGCSARPVTLWEGSSVIPLWFYKLKTVVPQSRLPIFLTDYVFLKFIVWRLQLVDFLPCPGPCISLGVLERDLDLQRVMVQAPDPLDKVQSVAMRVA